MFNYYIILFVIMFMIGISLNPMNLLAFRFNDLYMSLTLFYGGLVMASNMIWGHEIVHYFSMGKFNKQIFIFGIGLAILFTMLLRKQYLIDDKNWLRRMISHHSTALTTSHNIYNQSNDERVKKLAKEIIITQEREIKLMKELLIN